MVSPLISEALSFSATNIRDSCLVVLHNCTIMPHNGFAVDLGSATTMKNITASDVLFHHCTTSHDRFRIDPNMCANIVMTTGAQMEWSVFLNYDLFDDVLEL